MASRPATDIHPLQTLWQPPALVAAILAGEGLALVLALAPGGTAGLALRFGLCSLLVQWILLSTLALLYLLRGPLGRGGSQRLAWASLGLLLGCTWAVGAIAWWGMLAGPSPGRAETLAWFGRITGISLTVGLFAIAAFQNHWRARRAALDAKQSQLEALQARVRPHFLFNTLNTGAALVHQRPGAAEQLLLDLADLFRAALSGPKEIPLADELSLARRYLDIEALRLGDRLRVDWDVPEPLPAVAVPTLSIQPLVENAIRHGIELAAGGGRLDILVREGAAGVEVQVRNDLPGPGARAGMGHQVGLASARERIRALSEGRGRLETRVQDGRYVATILLPPAQPTTR